MNDFRDGHQPTTPEELFSMKHYSARNVIKRCFKLLKKRWAILRSLAFYDIKTQGRIISVCCMLHNFIRKEMSFDEIELEMINKLTPDIDFDSALIDAIEPSNEWNIWRQNLVQDMSNTWQASRNS